MLLLSRLYTGRDAELQPKQVEAASRLDLFRVAILVSRGYLSQVFVLFR